ncbi:hypothetical protein [Acidithiobacillus ferrooxidans]|nr:hypothetical protein [Acidithiobacillus ferrooxidans]MCR1347909.1 hypothetical protein [Acidithiobacillus ferrooxidans]
MQAVFVTASGTDAASMGQGTAQASEAAAPRLVQGSAAAPPVSTA